LVLNDFEARKLSADRPLELAHWLASSFDAKALCIVAKSAPDLGDSLPIQTFEASGSAEFISRHKAAKSV
jgi:hypothetical protein